MSAPELMPCPFCGNDDIWVVYHDKPDETTAQDYKTFAEENNINVPFYHNVWLECDFCKARGKEYETLKKAIHAWNMRLGR